MRILPLCAAVLLSSVGCNHSTGNGDAGIGGGDGGAFALTITPADVTLDLVTGGAPPTQSFAVTYQGKDITSSCMFALSDTTVGSLSGHLFSASSTQGGTTTLTATYMDKMGQAVIHVKVHGSFNASDCLSGGTDGGTGTCGTFPGDNAPACANTGGAPTVVYPPDGVLLPPNMGVITVQFQPGTGNNLFELDFINAATDVRILTKCTTTVKDTRMVDTKGCEVKLDQAMWDFIAGANKGGDAIKVSIRATPDETCASPSTNSVNIAFSTEDLLGAIYYWKSTITAGQGTGGDIWRKSFGDTNPEEAMTNGVGARQCFGCHSLSRDGQRMVINVDDNDSDDEYGDVEFGLMDVAAKHFITGGTNGNGNPPGFQTFNSDHTLFLSTDGDGTQGIFFNNMTLWNGATGMPATPANALVMGVAGARVAEPDWSADNKNVVFATGGFFALLGYLDDSHMTGGSLWTMPYNGSGVFGAATEIVTSTGENNYYPSYSPDGQFIIFDRVPKQPGTNAADNDSFSNPKARVFILPTKTGAAPVDCALLNSTGDLSNSWPRWSPFIQTYKGNRLLWVTFSSTRNYGLSVRNDTMVSGQAQVQCYPPDSPEDPPGAHGQGFAANCRQPQLWMAAINLSQAEIGISDPSFPAFWLPFQDIKTHNHTAQWTTTVVTMPPTDGGTCLMNGENCAARPNDCCNGVCVSDGTCGIP